MLNFDPPTLIPVPPVRIQGNYIGLNLDSFPTFTMSGDNKIQFRDSGQYIHSASVNRLNIGGFVSIGFEISGVEQLKIQNGELLPTTTNDIDLGSSTFFFKDAYLTSNLYFGDTLTSLNGATGDLSFNVASGKDFTFKIATTAELTIDASRMLLAGANELHFRDTGAKIYSAFTGGLVFDANVIVQYGIGGVAKLLVTVGGSVFTTSLSAENYISVVATGTKPYACGSTTLNNNLNADLLDGKEAVELNPTTTKGDLVGYDTVEARIPIGSNDQVLTADSTKALGLKWATAAGGGDVSAASNMTDHSIVRGDGGVKGVQDSAILIDDTDNITGVTTLAIDVTTGTAPLTIASATVVPTLNVDQVDGKHAADLNPATTKGDLVGFSTVPARLAVVSDGKFLKTDSSAATGISWSNISAPSPITVSTTQVFSGTSPTSMTNLDLSGTIGSNVAVVALSFKSASDMNAIAVRKDGDANDYYDASAEANAYGCQLGHHDSTADLVLIVGASSSGIIEWQTETARTCTVDILW